MIVLAHNSAPVDQVAFAPTGSFLAVGHDYLDIHFWDLSTQTLLAELERRHGYARSEFRFHPTQPGIYCLADLGDEGEVYWFDPVGKDADRIAKGVGWAENVLLTRDANRLLVHERGYSEFRLIDLSGGSVGTRVWTVPVYSTVAHGARVSMELFPDEERFVVAENHGNTRTRVTVRSLATGEMLDATRFPHRETLALALSPDGATAVVIAETSLFVYNANDLSDEPRKVKSDSRKHFTGVAYHPSGKYLAATSNDQTVKLFDTTTWSMVKIFTWDIGRMRRVAFNADGTLAAAGSDTGKVVVWDVDV